MFGPTSRIRQCSNGVISAILTKLWMCESCESPTELLLPRNATAKRGRICSKVASPKTETEQQKRVRKMLAECLCNLYINTSARTSPALNPRRRINRPKVTLRDELLLDCGIVRTKWPFLEECHCAL